MRMRIHSSAAVAALLLALCVAAPALAQETIPPNDPTSSELIETMRVPGDVSKGLAWDGKTITFHGEAIGESMKRGAYSWIHLNDDAYMERNVEEGAELGGYNTGMPVWVSADLAGQVDTFGDYKHEGSIVEVVGVFNGACAEHGGDMDIHATGLKVVRPGHAAIDPIHPWKIWLALGLVVCAALLYWLEMRRRNQVGLIPRRR